MFPRWHILFGAIFALLIWIAAPSTNLIYLLLILSSSILIDFDHYLCSVFKTKKFSLFYSFKYHEKLREEEIRKRDTGIKEKSDFHIFHTIEIHILIGLLGFLWTGFFYVFLGMVFHSLLDVYSMLNERVLFQREYLLFNWLRKRLKKKIK